jgi:hypothetical protein
MSEKVNLVKSAFKTVDDFLDNIGLGRPLEKIIDFFEATAPSRFAKKAGLPPAPGEFVDQLVGTALYEIYKAPVPKAGEEVVKKAKSVVKGG